MMLQKVFNGDDVKYVSDEIACHLWGKAYIIPVTWNSDINNNFVSATLAHGKKLSVMIFVMSYAT